MPFSEDTAQILRQEQFAIRKINSANRQLDATLRSAGIDTNHSGDATNQVIAKARKDIAKKVADGTLSDWDQANIIATTCEAAKKLEVREQLLNPEYWVRSLDIARKGDYAEDFTGAGLAMQVGLGLIPGVGQAADIRDFIYAVSHTKDNNFWANAGLIGLSLFALIPVVGDIGKGLKGLKYLKYADEAVDVLDAVGDVAKHGDEVADVAKNVDGLDEIFEGGSKANLTEAVGNLSKDKPVVVIGQSMGRVDPVAEELNKLGFNVQTYNPQNFQSSYGNLLRKDVENNRSWLKYWTQTKGATVIDIGVDPLKASQGISSPFYDVELRSIYDNWQYENVIKFDPDMN